MTARPTDDELYDEIRGDAYRAGLRDARAGHRLIRRDRVDWLLTDGAVDFWNDQTKDWYKPVNVLKALHDHITGEEK